ncbi:phosphate ABC transporter permease PstA [Dehalococcoidia bacterium]|nr:phosphate ABC transporter permease PstA [Dehalococcoidia bacterium]
MRGIQQPRGLRGRKLRDRAFYLVFASATLLGVAVLVTLLVRVLMVGLPQLDWDFIVSYPSRFPSKAGMFSALMGTIWVMGLTALISFPLGVGTALYLEEYAPKNSLTSIIQTNIANLAGVPSIVYGMLGVTLFVRWLALDRSILAGALTMTLLILPITIIASREAIRSVPKSLPEAAYALGSTKWQAIRRVLLPYAFPGILTGTILSMSRAVGETAPLIIMGALTFIAFVPGSDGLAKAPLDPFTVLPIQIFNWASRPQKEFQDLAATGIVVLLIVLLAMNTIAIVLRDRLQKKVQD